MTATMTLHQQEMRMTGMNKLSLLLLLGILLSSCSKDDLFSGVKSEAEEVHKGFKLPTKDRVEILMDRGICEYKVNDKTGTFGDTSSMSLLIIPVDTLRYINITTKHQTKANPIKEVKMVYNQGKNSRIVHNVAGIEYSENHLK